MNGQVDTAAVRKAADALEEARTRKAAAEGNLAKVRKLCGQTGYSIIVGDVRLSVAEMDSWTYNARLIRGREMIHLGALKALQGVIDHWSAEVVKRERALAALANPSGIQP